MKRPSRYWLFAVFLQQRLGFIRSGWQSLGITSENEPVNLFDGNRVSHFSLEESYACVYSRVLYVPLFNPGGLRGGTGACSAQEVYAEER